jgi:hypothetical protein
VGQPGIGTGLGEVGAFAQEPVAGVHRVASVLPRHRDQRGDVEVGRRAAGVQCHGLLGQRRVQCAGIVAGVHGHGGDAEILRGTDDPHGDLAAVGDQKFLQAHADHATGRLSRPASPW